MNTKEKILAAAEELVLAQGFEKVTMTDITKALGISQPALYKHYKNKSQVWESLTKTWLDKITADLQPFRPKAGASRADICHDWLWTLCLSKYQAYQDSPKMFALYTRYVALEPEIADYHVETLLASLAEATGIAEADSEALRALYYLGSRFHHSAFASRWGALADFQADFEACWQLILPYFSEK